MDQGPFTINAEQATFYSNWIAAFNDDPRTEDEIDQLKDDFVAFLDEKSESLTYEVDRGDFVIRLKNGIWDDLRELINVVNEYVDFVVDNQIPWAFDNIISFEFDQQFGRGIISINSDVELIEVHYRTEDSNRVLIETYSLTEREEKLE